MSAKSPLDLGARDCAAGDSDSDPSHCITCGDSGVEMTVMATDAARGLALCVDAEKGRQTVETALVEPVAPGDRLLVHAGTAIAAIAGSEAVR